MYRSQLHAWEATRAAGLAGAPARRQPRDPPPTPAPDPRQAQLDNFFDLLHSRIHEVSPPAGAVVVPQLFGAAAGPNACGLPYGVLAFLSIRHLTYDILAAVLDHAWPVQARAAYERCLIQQAPEVLLASGVPPWPLSRAATKPYYTAGLDAPAARRVSRAFHTTSPASGRSLSQADVAVCGRRSTRIYTLYPYIYPNNGRQPIAAQHPGLCYQPIRCGTARTRRWGEAAARMARWAATLTSPAERTTSCSSRSLYISLTGPAQRESNSKAVVVVVCSTPRSVASFLRRAAGWPAAAAAAGSARFLLPVAAAALRGGMANGARVKPGGWRSVFLVRWGWRPSGLDASAVNVNQAATKRVAGRPVHVHIGAAVACTTNLGL